MLITECRVGQRVNFGRGNGEQTLGEIVKVNRAKVKVKQLESRGTNRSYAVGTLWTVPPSLCSLADASASPSTPAPRPTRSFGQSPRDILAAKGIRTGDTVEFTFRGDHLTGRISRINAKRVTIDDVPGLPRGVYANPSSILRKVDAAAPKAKAAFSVGDTGTVKGWYGNGRSDAVVTKVNTDGSFEVYDGGGCGRRIQASDFAKGPVSEAGLLSLGERAVSGLSPENLHCDGEVSRTEARRRGASLKRVFPALSKAVGYSVTEDDCERRMLDAYRRRA